MDEPHKDADEILRYVKEAVIRMLSEIISDPTDQTAEQRHERRINVTVIQLLYFRAGLAGVAPTEICWSHRATDDWSIGYVWGFEASFIERIGGGPDVAGFANMAMLFITLYGQKEGAELCGWALRLQEKYHPSRTRLTRAFPHGVMAGWRDAGEWLSSRGDRVPLRWFERLNEGL
jgi:hypothetical protein